MDSLTNLKSNLYKISEYAYYIICFLHNFFSSYFLCFIYLFESRFNLHSEVIRVTRIFTKWQRSKRNTCNLFENEGRRRVSKNYEVIKNKTLHDHKYNFFPSYFFVFYLFIFCLYFFNFASFLFINISLFNNNKYDNIPR